MENSLPVGNFRNLFKDFLSDLELAFPELKDNIDNVRNEENKLKDDEIISFINKLANDKNFEKKLKENFNKIEIRNANELMWNFIKNEK